MGLYTHGVPLLPKKIKQLTLHGKIIVALALILPLLHFSNPVQAREEVPDNLIEQKASQMNEVILGASQNLNLTAIVDKQNGTTSLEWTQIGDQGTRYKVYQKIDGGAETYITVADNKTTLNTPDKTPPSEPIIIATKKEDETGFNISITAPQDNGTKYTHRIEEIIDNTQVNGDVVFLIDLSGSMDAFVGLFRREDGPIFEISKKLIQQYNMRVGTMVMANKANQMIIGDFTQNLNTIRKYISEFDQRNNHLFSVGLEEAVKKLEESNSKNKIIILFTDYNSDYDWQIESVSAIETKKAQLRDMQQKGIKLYTIYREKNSYLYIDQYSEAFEVQESANKDKQIAAFNKIFNYVVDDLPAESNVLTTTVTSGIQGYKYAITTSPTHTFTAKDPIVSLEELPTYISSEDNYIQYFHLAAVDNAQNTSITSSHLLYVKPSIKLETEYEYGMNYVPLTWKINDPTPGYTYRLFQIEAGETTEIQIPSSNSQLAEKSRETKTIKYTTPGTWEWTVPEGVTSVNVTIAGAGGGGGRWMCSWIL